MVEEQKESTNSSSPRRSNSQTSQHVLGGAALLKSVSPGPAAYNLDHFNIGKNKQGFSLKSRIAPPKDDGTPGPGEHLSVDFKPEGSKFSMAARLSPSKPSTEVPGPGAYYQGQLPTSIGEGPKTFVRGRIPDTKQDFTPGPIYEVNVAHSKIVSSPPRFSLAGRHKTVDKREVPGAGTYNPHEYESIGKSGKRFSLAGRIQSKERPDLQTPGPGHYEAKESVGKETPRYTMAPRNPILKPSTTAYPGPGSYNPSLSNISTINADGPSILMHGKIKDEKPDPNPGPGSYDAQSAYNKLRSSVSKSLAGKIITKSKAGEIPGPGTYNAIDAFNRINKANSISMSSRVGIADHNQSTPGPIYNLPEKKEGPSFSMGRRFIHRNKEAEAMPPPGTYEPKLPNNAPSFSLASRVAKDAKDEFPGPGTYSVNSRKAGPQFSFAAKLPYTSSMFATSTNIKDLRLKTEPQTARSAPSPSVLSSSGSMTAR